MTEFKTPVLSSSLVFFLSAALLLGASLHGILPHDQVLLALECVGVFVLLFVFLSGMYQNRAFSVVTWFFWISLLLSVLYVVPLPIPDEFNFPGRALYSDVHLWLEGQGIETESHFLSLIPYKSSLALLALLPAVALFYSGLSLPEKQLRRLVLLLLMIAVVQAALGLIQYASGNPAFYFGLPAGGRSAQGTYVNRDHFSALMVMTLPLSIGLMLFSVGRGGHRRGSNDKGHRFNRVLLFGFFAIFIFLGAVFSRSRAGVFLIMLAILMSSVVFSRHVGGKQSVGLSAVFATVSIGLAFIIGLIPVLNRFVGQNPVEDERWRVFYHTIEGIKAFFPFGSGPGTFPDVYRAFQPVEQVGFVNRAHNDYLELLFDLGAVGAFIIVGFWLVYLISWFRLAGQWGQVHFIQVAAGIGLFLVLLHCSVDFILHEPMNMMVFGLLAGIYFSKR